ncbi:thiamine diphosphokinase [Sedimentimonas flavescens]|uniref:Thiamine diphosphokinase n=1 Tax=Sedimentimonas flavescens TaxID=2851012 RepID=A0ABT2ZWR4_9RHOB|nr:thiamine diphosphokinase [Sedimentimonas flavescens]MCV2878186.1 thiamine diphosphokinase [Sedimentimonas flavescens]
MTVEFVHISGGVTLLGGGAVAADDLQSALTIAPRLIAADGGGDRALELGAVPEAVIGDMDSLSAAARARLAGRIHEIAEQDSTDFGKCLTHVRAEFYLALGFTGLRLDHTLATLNEVAQRAGQRILLIGEEDVIFRAPEALAIDLPIGARFSIFPFGRVEGRSEGLRWPIDGLELTPDGRVGTSNEVAGAVRLWLRGPALILLPKPHLPAALSALGLR